MSSRTLILLGILIGSLVLSVASCGLFTPTGRDPRTGNQVTLDELEQARDAAREQAIAEQQAADAAAERELLRLRREAELRLRRLDLDQQDQVLGLQAESDAAVDELVGRGAAGQAEREQHISTMLARYDQEIASVQRRHEALAQVLPILETATTAAGVPTFGLLPAVLGILGIGGTGVFAAAKAKEARTTKSAAEAIVDSLDVLKSVSPAVAAAFKENKTLIDQWQGPAGKALVERLQAAA